MTTDTPRTEAARERYYDGKTSDWVHYSTCRMIEQELAASKAEAAKLREQLASAIEIAREFRSFKALHYQCSCSYCQKFSNLKNEIK
jgi:hypothetical protein